MGCSICIITMWDYVTHFFDHFSIFCFLCMNLISTKTTTSVDWVCIVSPVLRRVCGKWCMFRKQLSSIWPHPQCVSTRHPCSPVQHRPHNSQLSQTWLLPIFTVSVCFHSRVRLHVRYQKQKCFPGLFSFFRMKSRDDIHLKQFIETPPALVFLGCYNDVAPRLMLVMTKNLHALFNYYRDREEDRKDLQESKPVDSLFFLSSQVCVFITCQ